MDEDAAPAAAAEVVAAAAADDDDAALLSAGSDSSMDGTMLPRRDRVRGVLLPASAPAPAAAAGPAAPPAPADERCRLFMKPMAPIGACRGDWATEAGCTNSEEEEEAEAAAG